MCLDTKCGGHTIAPSRITTQWWSAPLNILTNLQLTDLPTSVFLDTRSHVAGTVGGSSVGVAPKADIYGLKVLDDSGSGSYSDVLSALSWIVTNGQTPGVVTMSLGGSYYSLGVWSRSPEVNT